MRGFGFSGFGFENGRAAAAPREWSPLDLGTALLAWWDASYAPSLAQSSGIVDAWSDRIGGRTVSQAITAKKPSWQPAALNGKPAVVFDGVDDALISGSSQGLPAGNESEEVWVLTSFTGDPTDTGIRCLLVTGSGTNTDRRVRRQANGYPQTFAGDGASFNTASASNSGVWSGPGVLRGRFGPDRIYISRDRTAEAQSVLFTMATNTTGLSIGSIGSTQYWLGPITDIIVTSPLSDAQASALREHLLAKGGLP